MRSTNGKYARCKKSTGGHALLCVPPVIRTVLGMDAVNKAGNTVCSTSVVLPAVPIANW
jgi:hypothetical protein